MNSSENVEKPWVIVTGSSAGIGETTARVLARSGFGVILASEQPEALRQVHKEIEAEGHRARYFDLNLLNPEEVAGFVDRVVAEVGFPEVLVNNAGIGLHKLLEESTDAEFRRVFEVNFFALTSLCRQAVHHMKQAGRGHIINISSASARRSLAHMSCYGATKGAVHCFSQALRLEVAHYGIAVTEILPISVRTEFFQRAGYQPKGLVQTPETIARLVERAIHTREAEICSSNITRLGFVLDVLAPNLAHKLVQWQQDRQKKRSES